MDWKSDLGILYVDDEPKSLKYFEGLIGPHAPVFTAANAEEGFRMFERNTNRIGLVLSDLKMPGENGLSFLTRVRDFDSSPIRILATAYTDLKVAVDALNDGLLYSYLCKPWDPFDMERRVRNALQHVEAARQRDKLLEEKSMAYQHLSMADRAATLDLLSCGLNHHVRNSLMIVKSFLALTPIKLEEELEREPNDTAFWYDQVNEVNNQVQNITDLLSRLSDVSSLPKLNITEGIDLLAVFKDAVRLVVDRDRVQVNYRCPDGFALIDADARRLAQVARMLLQESQSNLKDDGEIEIKIEEDRSSSRYRVNIIDNGAPLDAEVFERLFDPFYVKADRPEEWGMNMIGCYLTIFYHGGMMGADGLPDGRNVLYFTIPQHPQKPCENTRISREILGRKANIREVVELAR